VLKWPRYYGRERERICLTTKDKHRWEIEQGVCHICGLAISIKKKNYLKGNNRRRRRRRIIMETQIFHHVKI
jgi:hypothetical protein